MADSPDGAASAFAMVEIDYFYEAGCPECEKIKDRILPELRERFAGMYLLRMHDISVMSNAVRMLAYRGKLRVSGNEPVWMVVDYGKVLNGYASIERGLFDAVSIGISGRMDPQWTPPRPIPVDWNRPAGTAADSMRGFLPAAIVIAGLADGVNPCAIGTLVFFVSVLSVSGMKGRSLLAAGLPFCAASFLAYTLMGLGFLRFLRALSGLHVLYRCAEFAIAAALLALAAISFRDAFLYARTGRESDMALRLGDGLRNRIHRLLREGARWPGIASASFVMGAVVTVLEAPCTGQGYIPALALMAKTGPSAWPAVGYLLLYNLMFVLPLAAVFALACRGAGTGRLVEFSRGNVPLAKALLGVMFLVLAVMILVF